jgi:hypothetical protein
MSVTYEYTQGIDAAILDAKYVDFAKTKVKLLVSELIGELNFNSELWGYIIEDLFVTKEEFDANVVILAQDGLKNPIIEELWTYLLYSRIQSSKMQRITVDLAAETTRTESLTREIQAANVAKNAAELQLQNELLNLARRPVRQGTGPEPEMVNETPEQKTLRILVSALTQDNKKPVKILSQVHFYGNSQDKGNNIILWLQSIEINMEYCRVPEDEKVRCASAHLNDYALRIFSNWTRSAKSTELCSWDHFKNEMKSRLLPLDHLEKVRDQLASIKQQNSVSRYNEEFEKLVSQLEIINTTTEALYITLYLRGLQTNVREAVKYFLLTTLKENMTRALLYDSSHQSERQGNRFPNETAANSVKNNSNVENKKRNKNRHKKNSYQNNNQNNNHNNNNNQNDKSLNGNTDFNNNKVLLSCTHCKRSGHSIEKCFQLHPELRNSDKNKNSNNSSNRNTKQKNTSSSTNMVNSDSYSDPTSNFMVSSIKETANNSIQTNSNEFCKVMVEIEGHKLLCILDSGAKTSALPLSFVKQAGIQIKPYSIPCQVASGEWKDTPITMALDTICCGTVTVLEYLVFDRNDGLLGMDWFNANQAYVRTFDQTLCFKNKSFSLNQYDEQDDYPASIPTASDYESNELDTLVASVASPDDIEELEEMDHEPWPTTSTYRSDSDFQILESDNLSKNQLNDLNKFIIKNSASFARDINDIKDHCNIDTFKINLTNSKPVSQRPYRVSPFENNHINKCVKEMLDAGVIRPSCSPFRSPVVLIPKKGGELRFCIDYRRLNAQTIKDGFPLPLIQESFDNLKNSKFFSSLDQKSGYWQIPMETSSIEKTAFVTNEGQWEFLVLPFGVTNGPAAFSRIMSTVLGDLKYVEIYLDDLLIHSVTIEQHYKHLEVVLKRLKEANLKLNFKKCYWFRKTLKFLGHIVSEGEIRVDPAKIEIINNWQTPRNVVQIQQFLGLSGYYRKFILHFADIAHPLYNLTKTRVLWEWTNDCTIAFNKLKKCLVSAPVLRMPDFTKTFYIYTDASGLALGAILGQIDENGKEFVIIFASRLLKGAELNYSVSEKEMLAVIWAIKLFRCYIYGTEFEIITDHSALQYLISIKDVNGRLARWAMYLQSYQFKIIHRAGKNHSNADALSRMVQQTEQVNSVDSLQIQSNAGRFDDVSMKTLDVWENDKLLFFLEHGKHLSGTTKQQVKYIARKSTHYVLECTVLNNDTVSKKIFYFSNKEDYSTRRIVPMPSERQAIIYDAHALGHFSVDKTAQNIASKYYWRNLWNQVELFIDSCLTCLRFKRATVLNHPALAIPVNDVMERISIDLVLGLPLTSSGYNGVMVITEHTSKYPYAVAIRSKSANEIARNLWHYFCLFGPAKEILSDCGKEFLNQVIDEMLKQVGTVRRHTSIYSPHVNGMTEKYNGTLCSSIRKNAEVDRLKWDLWLDGCLHEYRKMIHKSTRMPPYDLFFGRQVPDFINFSLEPNSADTAALIRRSAQIQHHQEIVIPKAIKNIKNAQEQQKKTQDSRNNILTATLVKGTLVAIRIPGLLKKLDERYRGPYLIVKRTPQGNYLLKNKMGKQLSNSFPLSKLKLVKDWATFDLTADDETGNTDCQKIERILNDRVQNGIKQYYIKWQGYTSDYNTWMDGTSITDLKQLDNYRSKWNTKASIVKWNAATTSSSVNTVSISQHKGKNSETDNSLKRTTLFHNTNQTNKTLNFKKMFVLLKIALLLILFSTIPCVKSSIINSTFKYCTTNSASLELDFSQTCEFHSSAFTKESEPYAIFEKTDYKLDGFGYRCNIIKSTYQTFKTFFGQERYSVDTVDVPMTRLECSKLVTTQFCYGNTMKCVDSSCAYNETPVLYYTWETERIFTTYSCHMQKIKLTSIEDKVFNEASNSCKVKDFFCIVGKYHYIWTNKELVMCPFYLIQTTQLKKINKFLFNDVLFFQINGSTTECINLKLLTTTENLYVSKIENDTILTNFKKDLANINEIKTLLISDLDRKTYSLVNMIEALSNSLNKKICTLLSLAINSQKEHENQFFSLKDEFMSNLIIYNNYGSLLIATCTNINQIDIVETNTICYKHIKVKFQINNISYLGFLAKEQILRHDSPVQPCDIPLVVQLQDGSHIKRLNGICSIINNKKFKYNFYHLIERPAELFMHDKTEFSYLNGHNPSSLTDDIRLEQVKHISDTKPNIILSSIISIGNFFNSIGKGIQQFITSILNFIYGAIILIAIGSILFVAIKFYQICYRNNLQKYKSPENMEMTHINSDQIIPTVGVPEINTEITTTQPFLRRGSKQPKHDV